MFSNSVIGYFRKLIVRVFKQTLLFIVVYNATYTETYSRFTLYIQCVRDTCYKRKYSLYP